MSEHHPSAAEGIAVIGGGSIGVAFAVLFARAGHPVRISDPSPDRRAIIPTEIAARLDGLAEHGLLEETTADIAARITTTDSVADAVSDAVLVQECAPERADLKRALFAEVDENAPPEAVLASSSSALPVSRFAAGLPGESRCLVAHPGNPPHLIPVIELVPAPFTTEATVEKAEAIYTDAGLSPIRVHGEPEGFVFNRLQGALLREAYCLVRDGVASVDDVDKAVRDGLGRRWSFMGPFETVDLNTRGGIESHAAKMGPAYERMGAERGQHDPWTGDLVAAVTAQRRALLPLDDWDKRVAWRDEQLMSNLLRTPDTTTEDHS